MAHGPSCSAACGIFPDQGSNPCPLHWQADSQPLCHQGSPQNNLFLRKWNMDIKITSFVPSQSEFIKQNYFIVLKGMQMFYTHTCTHSSTSAPTPHLCIYLYLYTYSDRIYTFYTLNGSVNQKIVFNKIYFLIIVSQYFIKSQMHKSSLEGLPWWCSGWDSVLPMQGAGTQSLVRELDPTCMPQLRVRMPQLSLRAATKEPTCHN